MAEYKRRENKLQCKLKYRKVDAREAKYTC